MASITDYLANPGWLSKLPGATPAMNPAEVSAMRGQDIQNMQQQLKYSEDLKNISVSAKERQLKMGDLDFNIAKQPTLLEQKFSEEQLRHQTAVNEEVAQDIPIALQGEQQYLGVWDKYNKMGVLPQELKNPDGSPAPFQQAIPFLKQFQLTTKNSIEQQRKLDLERIRASSGGSVPSFTQVPFTNNQKEVAFNTLDSFITENKYDLGDKADKKSDAHFLGNVLAEIPNTFARYLSDRGSPVSEPSVRQTLLSLAQQHIQDRRIDYPVLGPARTPIRQDYTLDKDAFLNAVDRTYGLSGGTTRTYLEGQLGESFNVSGPVGVLGPEILNKVRETLKKLPEGKGVKVNGVWYKLGADGEPERVD